MPTSKEMIEKFENLPEDVRDAIFDVNTSDIIQAIGKKYDLALDKTGLLADETGQLMLGFTNPKDFIGKLEKQLGIDREKAKKIAEEINEQIFKKIKASLRAIHSIEESEEKKEPKDTKPAAMSYPQTPPPAPSSQPASSPFEEKLEDKVFHVPEGEAGSASIQTNKDEAESAKKESRYPGKEDPYMEPVD